MKVEWDKNSDAYEAVEKIVLDRFGEFGESIVVQLRMKYNEPEEDYETSELLLNDGEDWLHPVWIWENDWWEGEKVVEVIAAAPISAIKLENEYML